MQLREKPKCAETLEPAGEIFPLDEYRGRLSVKRRPKADPLPAAFSLIPSEPIDATVMKEAIYRYAESVIDRKLGYTAVRSILTREHPRWWRAPSCSWRVVGRSSS